MRTAAAWICLPLSIAVAAAAGEGPVLFSWTPSDGGSGWSVGVGAGDGKNDPLAGAPLDAPVWFERLPDISVPLLDGGAFPLAAAGGKVLLLDFWASWCAPCIQELPHLQELYSAEEPRGLAALAINVEEPAATARRTAASLKLTMPIGTSSPVVDDTFHARQLPLVVLADRQGRIRERWDGWLPGLEKTIAARVRELEAEDPAGPRRTVGEVFEGKGWVDVEWVRDVGAEVTGLAVVSFADGRTQIAAASGKDVTLIEPTGRIARRFKVPSSAGRIVAADLDGNGEPEVVGFRPGGMEIVSFPLKSAAPQTFSAPAYLRDVAAVGAAPPGRPEGTLALAAVDGLYLSDRQGKRIRRVEGTGETVAVRATGSGAATRFVALGADGAVRWVDLEGRIERTAPARPGDAKLVTGVDEHAGFGTATAAVAALASGRVLPGGGVQVAVAAGETLLFVDLSKRDALWRARWPGLRDLAPADLGRDGKNELVVAAGRTVALLRSRR